ncbi:MAG: lamin tail domain-containing protein [Verrucomicrobiota bacterium]
MNGIRLLVALAFAALLVAAPASPASPSGIVVSQVYAGGGNSGASFTNDYVELFNAGSASVTVDGWTVQYASAAGSSWQTTALAGSIAPGGRFLVELASGGTVGAALPVPDATGTSNMAVSGGKVAVVTDSTALTCGASAGSCSTVGSITDLVGYGSAADYEGAAAAPAPSSSTAAVRADGGCTDTDSNADDFTSGTPTPLNSAASPTTCSPGPPTGGGVSSSATVDVDVQPVLSLALEQATLGFGAAYSGDTPPAVSERATVVSNNAAGYALTIHRSAFTPADLPLGIASTAPPGGTLGPALVGGARPAIPVAPAADLLVGTTSARSAAGGDAWPTTIGFTAPLPVVAPGRYSATITYTVIGR